MKRRLFCTLLALVMCVFSLSGCEKTPKPVEFTTIAMDTVMSFTLYGSEDECSTARSIINTSLSNYEAALSTTLESSVVSQINQGAGQPVEAASAVQLLSRALELCEITGGALDITAYPAVKAWGFTQEEYRVPSPAELEALAKKIDYSAVKLEGEMITLPDGAEIDLGAVAKGYVGDVMAEQIGLSSALLNLGQSVIVAVGAKPGEKPWCIGVTDPARPEKYFAVVELADMAMGTSGGYQRYFERDGVTYWHILDPDTAAPARSGLASVTVVAPSALTCDGLSTALFVMGLEKGAQFWRDHPELEFEAIFVTEDGEFYRTAGLEGCFSLAEGYENLEVTVLE